MAKTKRVQHAAGARLGMQDLCNRARSEIDLAARLRKFAERATSALWFAASWIRVCIMCLCLYFCACSSTCQAARHPVAHGLAEGMLLSLRCAPLELQGGFGQGGFGLQGG